MRVVGGFLGGRHFNPKMNKWPTRPTTDQAKEALFNILANKIDFEDIKFLDLFGGTGGISFEMASRGCTRITYVDKYRACADFVRNQAKIFDVSEDINVLTKDVLRFIKQTEETYDFIFADPPYNWIEMESFPRTILSLNLLNKDGVFILEHDTSVSFDFNDNFVEKRKYGQTIFSIFR